jgi:kinetochore protein Mis13/DSN1
VWQSLAKPIPELPPLYPNEKVSKPPLPDESLLDEEESKMLQSLTDAGSTFALLRKQTQSRLRAIQSSLEFKIDHLADNVHKLDQRLDTASRQADAVVERAAKRLKAREDREKAAVGTNEVPVMEVLRSLGRILPEGG